MVITIASVALDGIQLKSHLSKGWGGGGDSVSAHRVEKNATSQGMPKLNHSGDRHPQPGGKKEGTVN